MSLFCLHHWEYPEYNDKLNLREGLKKCQKCQSIRGYKRFVPIESTNLDDINNEEDRTLDSSFNSFSLIGISLIIFVMITAIILVTKIVPIYLNQFSNITGSNSNNTVLLTIFILPIIIGGIAMFHWLRNGFDP